MNLIKKGVIIAQGIFKYKGKNIKTLADALAADKCGCFYVDCCPIPHFKLTDATGGGKDYFWNDGGTLTNGTQEELDAAAEALA